MDIQNLQEVKSVLLEGVPAAKRSYVSSVLDRQIQYLNETAPAGAVDASSIAGFRKVLLPMVRRIIPGTIATELVGVQTMKGPVDLVYSMRYKYNDAVNGVPAGAELFGNAHPITRFYSGGTDQAQLPGAGGFGPRFDVSDAQDGSAISGLSGIVGTATGDGWGATLGLSATTPHISRGGSGSYIESSGGRSISIEVVSQAVQSQTRKLQASWTVEAMQDMKNQHDLSIEDELTKGMSAEIVQEIDAEIIGDLTALAGTVGTFSGALPGAAGYYQPTFVGDRLANVGGVINYVKNEVARKTRRGAANWLVASPMVTSMLQTAVKSVFAPALEGSFKGPNNTQLIGTLNGDMKVYSYLWNQAQAVPGGTGNDTILLGYKGGNSETDAGYFYCPYVPVMSSGVVMNPVTMNPVVGLMTRYGKAVFTDTATSLGNSADYYAKITVTGLSFA